MSSLIRNTELLVEEFNEAIRNDLRNKGIDNNGDASDSLYVQTDKEANEIKISSKGIFYLEYLDRGTGPWKNPEKYKFLGRLLSEDGNNWIAKTDGLNPYAVAHTIANEGSRIYKDKSKGIELDKKRDELQRQIKEQAPKWAKQDLLNLLKITHNKLQKV